MKTTTTKVKASTIHTVLSMAWAVPAIPTLLYWREKENQPEASPR